MGKFDLPIHKNHLRSRADVQQALRQILEPACAHFTEGHAGLHLGDFGAHYGENSIRVEAFSRMLWGLAPLWSQGEGLEYLPSFRAGLVSGTDPQHPAYWGEVFDFDQKIVEMAAIAVTLMLAGDALALDEREARNLHTWLGGIYGKDLPQNNWLFFRVLVSAAFRLRGWDYDKAQMEADLVRLDSYYLGDGWYCDGRPTQMDYYVPFGMHYYALIYAHCMAEFDPARSHAFKAQAAQFAPDYLYWFEESGAAVPFGRSLTYRFGQCAFFSAAAFAGVEGLSWGVLKSRVLGNLRWWFAQPIFTSDGLLTVGYAYPNLCMSENYNAPGSPYWALKAFLCLALPAEHPFWTAQEEVPVLAPLKALPQARMLLARDTQQVQMFVAGQHCVNELGLCAAKYEKLVYSSRFGFSIPRGDSLEEGAFDSVLAVSEAGEERYRVGRGFTSYALTATNFRRSYCPLRGVTVEVTVTPSFPSHKREYTITTDRAIDVADGGFSVPAERGGVPFDPRMVEETQRGITARFPWGTSGITCLEGGGVPALIKAFPNTNLLHPVTRIPTIKLHLEAGVHRMVTVVTGEIPKE